MFIRANNGNSYNVDQIVHYYVEDDGTVDKMYHVIASLTTGANVYLWHKGSKDHCDRVVEYLDKELVSPSIDFYDDTLFGLDDETDAMHAGSDN